MADVIINEANSLRHSNNILSASDIWNSSLRVIKGEHRITPYQPVASAQHVSTDTLAFQSKLFGKSRESHANIKNWPTFSRTCVLEETGSSKSF